MSSLSGFSFSSEDIKVASEATVNPYLAQPSNGLDLLMQLVGQAPLHVDKGDSASLNRLETLIHEDFVKLAERDNFPAEAKAFRELQDLLESLEDMVSFPDLVNKTVIGVGGGFSAGKSRFLNSMLGVSLLPEALEPTTAIPTFLTTGKEASIVALNTFNHHVPLDPEALEAISHRFHAHYKQTLGREIGFSHLLKLLMVHQPGFAWSNLAFLDTPGYSKADVQGGEATDAHLAHRQLNEADHVLWLVNAKNGSIRQDDVDFLRKLAPRNPIFVVLTQSDLVPSSQVQSILDSVRETLSKAGISFAGAMAWKAPISSLKGERVLGDNVEDWLNALNQQPKRTSKRLACARVLDAYILHNVTQLQTNKSQLSLFNEILPMTDAMSGNRRDAISNLVSDLRQDQKRLESLVSDFGELKSQMLSAITEIVGKVALDEEIRQGKEMTYQSRLDAFSKPVTVGQKLDAVVSAIQSDIKRVSLSIGDGVAQLIIPFSQFRQELEIDPMTLIKGTVLRSEVVAQSDKHVSLTIFQ